MTAKTEGEQADSHQLKEREARKKALRAALIEGENSGLSTAFDFDEFIARHRRERTTSR